MIQDLERSTYSNIEMQSLEFVKHTLMPWLKRFEATIWRSLLPDNEKESHFVEFLVDGLLRGDIKSRYDAYMTAVTNGWMSRNEVREKENMNPEDGLDDFLVPMNMSKEGEEPPPEPAPAPVPAPPSEPANQERIVRDSVARVVRQEIAEIRKRSTKFKDEPEGMLSWLEKFYARLSGKLVETLYLSKEKAGRYCDERKTELVERGLAVLDSWEEENGERLTALVIGGEHA